MEAPAFTSDGRKRPWKNGSASRACVAARYDTTRRGMFRQPAREWPMSNGNCTITLQNNTTETVWLSDYSHTFEHGGWDQTPPSSLEAGKGSNNCELSYIFDPNESLTFSIVYAGSGGKPSFTIGGQIAQGSGEVSLTPSGIATGRHTVNSEVQQRGSNFAVSFTFE
jgi:hypothetical protein